MCLTAPARLVSSDGSDGIVELDGRPRRASLLLVPEAAPGDWLLVGAGHALRRLEPAEARELTDLIAAATTATDSAAASSAATDGTAAATAATDCTAAATAIGPSSTTGGRP